MLKQKQLSCIISQKSFSAPIGIKVASAPNTSQILFLVSVPENRC